MNEADSTWQGSKIQATKTETDAVVEKFGLNDGDHFISTLDETTPMNLIVLNNHFEAAQAAQADWVSVFYWIEQVLSLLSMPKSMGIPLTVCRTGP